MKNCWLAAVAMNYTVGIPHAKSCHTDNGWFVTAAIPDAVS